MSSSLSLEMTTVGGAVGGLAPQNGTLRGIGKVWLEGIYWICVNNAWTSYIAVRVTHAVMPSYPESIVLQRSLANKQKPMLHGNNGNWDDVVKRSFLYWSFLAIQYARTLLIHKQGHKQNNRVTAHSAGRPSNAARGLDRARHVDVDGRPRNTEHAFEIKTANHEAFLVYLIRAELLTYHHLSNNVNAATTHHLNFVVPFPAFPIYTCNFRSGPTRSRGSSVAPWLDGQGFHCACLSLAIPHPLINYRDAATDLSFSPDNPCIFFLVCSTLKPSSRTSPSRP